MDIDIELWVRSLVAGASAVPAALIAVTLLGGPTLIWLLYRWVVKPKSSRYHVSQIGALWICAGCRSANELRSSNCYRCHRELDESELELLNPGLRESVPMPRADGGCTAGPPSPSGRAEPSHQRERSGSRRRGAGQGRRRAPSRRTGGTNVPVEGRPTGQARSRPLGQAEGGAPRPADGRSTSQAQGGAPASRRGGTRRAEAVRSAVRPSASLGRSGRGPSCPRSGAVTARIPDTR